MKRICELNGMEMVKDTYFITEDGRVLREKNSKRYGRQLKEVSGRENKTGYLQVALVTIEGSYKEAYKHRLVGLAFVDGYFEGAVIDHINYDRTDNHCTNLRWLTQKENLSHSRENINDGYKVWRAKFNK